MQTNIISVFSDAAHAQAAHDELIATGFLREQVHINPHSTPEAQTHDADMALDKTDTLDFGGTSIGKFFRHLFGMDDGESARSNALDGSAERFVVAIEAMNASERDHAMVVLRDHHPIDIAEQSIESPQAAEDRMNMARHPTDTDPERGMGVDTEGFVVRQESDPTGEPAQYYDERVPHSSGLGAVVSEAMDADNVRPSAQPMDTRTHRAAMRDESLRDEPFGQPAAKETVHPDGTLHPRSDHTMDAGIDAGTDAMPDDQDVVRSYIASDFDDSRVPQQSAMLDTSMRADEAMQGRAAQAPEVINVDASGNAHMQEHMQGTDFANTVKRASDEDYRHHWQNAYAREGGRYEDYDAAYRYGAQANQDGRYRESDWDDIEPDMRQEWENAHPTTAWERIKQAVRYGAGHRPH